MRKGTIAVLSSIIGAIGGTVGGSIYANKAVNEKSAKVEKFRCYYNLLNQWLILKQEGKSIEDFFVKNDYKTIAIYGMGEMGNRLYDELRNTEIRVIYAIDKNKDSAYSELEIYDLEDSIEKVDAIIVTAVFAFDEIESELSEKIDSKIVSLEDVIYES